MTEHIRIRQFQNFNLIMTPVYICNDPSFDSSLHLYISAKARDRLITVSSRILQGSYLKRRFETAPLIIQVECLPQKLQTWGSFDRLDA